MFSEKTTPLRLCNIKNISIFVFDYDLNDNHLPVKTMIYDVFISYSHQDSEVANELCALLVSAGVSYYIDSDRIDGGSYFSDSIANAISHCKVFLLLVSQNSMKSEYVNKELHYFVHHKLPTASLVPYRLDNSILKNDWDLVLSDVHYRRMSKEPMAPYLIHDILVCLKQPVPVRFAIHEQTQPDKLKWKYRGGVVDVHETSDGADGEQLDRAEIISGVDVVDVETKEKRRRGVKSWPLWLNMLISLIIALIATAVTIVVVNKVVPDVIDDHTNVLEEFTRADSLYEVAERYEMHNEFAEAIAQYNVLYELDSVRALCGLGRCYSSISYVERNDSIAAKYYQRAADCDSPEALYRLGDCYLSGQGMRPDTVRAFSVFVQAAKLDYIDAMWRVSDCYYKGCGVNRNETFGKYWKDRAVDLMNNSQD